MSNADAWGLNGVLDFFSERSTTDQVYPSEWFFLKDRLRNGMRVLDVGCAQGGFASMLSEHLDQFSYTGIDISPAMLERARARHPGHTFHTISENADWTFLGGETFDLVLVLGILHLHEGWRETMTRAWSHTEGCLLMDLRETEGPTVEDKAHSFFRMDFGGGGDDHGTVTLPYVLVNSAEALGTVRRLAPGARRISHYGYIHPVSASASVPVDGVMTNVWCVEH